MGCSPGGYPISQAYTKYRTLPAHHKIKDICDKYANIDFGLGKGIFPKGKEPACPAHPNCMCKLNPVFR
ncbi:hypothetical protein BLW93_08245 [Desulfurobacterium indicum]|uniref:Uncharacterized protein n=1 Tax=Desulfurobacterium indicum TaxID=1914305 RepID=A0A1R1MJA6_9BACT|nr:hypothetical protein BLW93_08245 [Desulfurobacterium indicum]